MSRAHISRSKTSFNVKSSTYYFHMKTEILIEFQICMNVPLITGHKERGCESQRKYLTIKMNSLNSQKREVIFWELTWELTCHKIWKPVNVGIILTLRIRPSGAGGGGGVCLPKVFWKCALFLKSPLNVSFLKILNLK